MRLGYPEDNIFSLPRLLYSTYTFWPTLPTIIIIMDQNQIMSEEQEEGYDPSHEKYLEKDPCSKLKTSKMELKKLKFIQKFPGIPQEEEDSPCKSRRTSIQRQKNYYEDTTLELNELKAKKYWENLDLTCFKPVTVDDLRFTKDKNTSNSNSVHLLEDEYLVHNKIHTFRAAMSQFLTPHVQHTKTIRALFEGYNHQKLLAFFALSTETHPQEENQQEKICLKLVATAKMDSILFEQSTIQYQKEIDQEIALWEKLATKNKNQNQFSWEILKSRVMVPEIRFIYNQTDIQLIKQKLNWSTIMKLFIEGHRDKTAGVFQSYSITGQDSDIEESFKCRKKKKFEADCKVCFYGANYQSNIVVYCDLCNTSFHIVCYGLQNLPKKEKYYCEVCNQFRLTEKDSRPSCKICQKKAFPMKKMDKHYYHITCLVLNNLVTYRNGELRLRKGISFSNITEMVISNEIASEICLFCNCSQGLKLSCGYEGCCQSFHSVCGYLNGCLFQVRREKGSSNLEVKVFCGVHISGRDWVQQVYFRRYACDFKRTSQLSFEQFKRLYFRELQFNSSLRKERGRQLQYDILEVTDLMMMESAQIRNRINRASVSVASRYSRKLQCGILS